MRLLHYILAGLAIVTAGTARPAAEPWHSSLFPEDWEPGFNDASGRFLHDFSYAGYHNGEAVPPSSGWGPVFDVVEQFGADPAGIFDATDEIQAAIDQAALAGGGIVYLPAGYYRCFGVLAVRSSNIVIRGAGPTRTFLYFTNAMGLTNYAHITFHGRIVRGGGLALAVDGESRSSTVYLHNAQQLRVGDEVAVGWVLTPDFVAEHGMTKSWKSPVGLWKPFFRRTITDIDTTVTPAAVTLDVPLRYPARVRDGASLRVESGYAGEVGIEHLSIANAVAWQDAWQETRQHAIAFKWVKDAWMRNVRSFPSPLAIAHGYHLQNCGLLVHGSKRVTVSECQLEKPQNRGPNGCGYLYEISASNEVLVRDCIGRDGRHNFIYNWDFGATGCVFLRCYSTGSATVAGPTSTVATRAYCEYHHSLAMACLVDSCVLDDGWYGGNRETQSGGAGHTVTQSVYWNTAGRGRIRSCQYGWGYIIGTQGIAVNTDISQIGGAGTAPTDMLEGLHLGASLEPASLHEAQLLRRTGRLPLDAPYCPRPHGGAYAVGDELCLMPPAPVSPAPVFVWRKDGERLHDTGRISGTTSRRLSILDLQEADSGLYTCHYEDGAKAPRVYMVEVTVLLPMPATRAGGLAAAAGLFMALFAALNRRARAGACSAPGTSQHIL